MNARITGIIQQQSFEIVRDQIGFILALELANQFVLNPDPALDVSEVWVERVLQWDKTELPAVNVMLADGTYGGQTVLQQDGTYRYYIEGYVNAKTQRATYTEGEQPGDQKAMIDLHRLLGVCRSIIEDAKYKTLGFDTPPGFVMNRHIESIQIGQPNQKEHDALSSAMGRLILSVKVPEYPAGYVIPIPISRMDTTVRMEQTDKGYKWIDYFS